MQIFVEKKSTLLSNNLRNSMNKKIVVIGSGFSGLSAAAALANMGYQVDVYEKNATPGGRARNFKEAGFTFDMGPTWYWLPDVFEEYFERFNKKVSEMYQLVRLDPSYRVYFGPGDFIDVPAGMDAIYRLFEEWEPGSSKRLKKFMEDARYKYQLGMKKLVYKPSLSYFEFLEPWLLRGIVHGDFLRSVSKVVRKNFRNMRLVRILEFPVIFLGATPWKTPSLYTLMNFADMGMGTWYPMGGMYSVVEAMVRLAEEQGAVFHYNAPVERILSRNGKAYGVRINGDIIEADLILSTADYHHTESELLDTEERSYSEKYWDTRKMAPSALLYYIGLDKPVQGLLHHNLFFDEDFDRHADEIYKTPQWPEKPAIYVSCSSKTDPAVAPEGYENLIVLIPVAPGLKDTEEIKQKYYELTLKRIEKLTGESLSGRVVYKRMYAHSDFSSDYHSFKGNAYGLANTLDQTAIFRPSLRSRKLKNLFYAGQLTVPGPGVPPSIISGYVASGQIDSYFKSL